MIQNVTHLQQTRNQAQNNTQTHTIHVTTQNTCAKNLINKKNTNIHNGVL
jgi:hypothetical protein